MDEAGYDLVFQGAFQVDQKSLFKLRIEAITRSNFQTVYQLPLAMMTSLFFIGAIIYEHPQTRPAPMKGTSARPVTELTHSFQG